jgi:predicted amidohydrolase
MSAAWRDLATRRADVRLRGGRLIDPANNRDGIADAAIRNGRVIAIGTAAQELAPRRTIDASGRSSRRASLTCTSTFASG